MPAATDRPPQHVCAAFGANSDELTLLPAGAGWQSDRIVLRPAEDKAELAWANRVLPAVSLPGLRIAKPARSTDGRQIVGGWMAYRTSPGVDVTDAVRPAPDDLLRLSIRLHEEIAGLPRPEFLGARQDALSRADRIAWGEESAALDETRGGRWFEVLAGSVRPITRADQIVHGDLYRCVRIDPDGLVVLTDFRPYYRPAEWACALIVVDTITHDAADADIIDRWAHLPEWPQVLLRAVLFRLAAYALTPHAPDSELDGLRTVAGVVSGIL